MTIPIAIVGGGKIARDQHIPSIAALGDFTLAAAVTTARSPLAEVANFRSIPEMMVAMPQVRAVALCTPPRGRHAQVMQAIQHGLDILNEKPPAATLSEAADFAASAKAAGVVLYQTWHSREAAAVEPAARWLAGKAIRRVVVTWKEDVRVWHPGQEWIWEPGIGIFDPGINAISVITKILPGPLTLERAELRFPENKAAPIAASLAYAGNGFPVTAEFDFDQKGPQTWDIDIDTDGGALKLSMGASKMAVNGKAVNVGEEPEYFHLYRRFAALVKGRQSDADFTPFAHVADAFMLGRRSVIEPFE
ncbi:MAG: Gfo/Idh/MocA family oxidoreductase [Alphaproteobacteria bacterium]|nr:Gfo/Idh/MocA family oxidoreductase [Alphaproteobacteria bacterium]